MLNTVGYIENEHVLNLISLRIKVFTIIQNYIPFQLKNEDLLFIFHSAIVFAD